MTGEIETEIGDNWSVFFFEVPCDIVKRVLIDLFQHIQEIEVASMPHFMIREFILTQHLGISLRVLRNKDNAEIVDSGLAKFFEMENLHYEKDPEGNRHAWLRRGTRSDHWNRKRCEALYQLSNLVVSLAKSDIFGGGDRCHMVHYLVNMLGLQEATLPCSNQVSFWDITSGEAYSFHTQQLPSV